MDDPLYGTGFGASLKIQCWDYVQFTDSYNLYYINSRLNREIYSYFVN